MSATDSEVISYVSNLQIKDNKVITTDSVIIQINNYKGEYATYITIPYSKNEKLNINDAWIEDVNGKIIRKLKSNEFTDHSAISDYSIYEDYFVKTAQLRHNQYPYRIVYSYQKSTADFLTKIWAPLLFNDQDVRSAKLIVSIPANDYPIRYKYENIKEPDIQTIGDKKIYSWEASYISEERQMYSPISELKIPKVYITPLNFKYGLKGSWDSWVSFGNWICKLNEKSTVLPESEKQKVDELILGINHPKEKIKILYQYMQKHTRYVNVSLKIGGLKTYPASYVVQNKYGDCKALSTYMIALLERAGLKAYYTLIKSGANVRPIDKNFPCQVFDHVIVTVPIEKDTLFLECTNKDIPMGYLGTFTQGRDALVIKEDSSYFIRTPELTPEDVTYSSFTNVSIKDNDLISCEIEMTLRGYAFETLNYYVSNHHKSEIEKISRNFIYAGNYNFESLVIKGDKNEKSEITLQAKIKPQNSFKSYGNDFVLSSFPFTLSQLEPIEERTQDIQLNYPISRNDTIVYHFSGVSLSDKKPEDITIESPYGNYSVRFDLNDNQLKVIKKLLIFKGSYSVNEYSEFYRFWSSIQANENKNYYLKR